MRSFLVCVYIILIGSGNLSAQQYELEPIDANTARNQQLLGNLDSGVSFSVRTNSFLSTKKNPGKSHFFLYSKLLLLNSSIQLFRTGGTMTL